MRWLKEFDYNNTLANWIHYNLSPNHDRERLQIVNFLLDRKHRRSYID